jgi:hypothetical protein
MTRPAATGWLTGPGLPVWLQVGYDDLKENGISALVTDQMSYGQRVPDSYYTTGTYSTSGKIIPST